MNFPDIATLLRKQASEFGPSTAIETPDGRSVSYAALFDQATGIAESLVAADLGDGGKRPRIGIVLPNGLDMALALLGAATAGEATPFNPRCKPAEFDAYFRSTRIDALIVHDEDNGPAVAIAEIMGIRLLRFGGEGRIAGYGSSKLEPPASDDIALVLMTSGSTGKPKIVPLTHRNICTSAEEVTRSMKLTPQDRCLTMWEQYHIGGLVDLLLAPLVSGGVVIATGGFDAAEFFELLHSKRPTWYQAVPTALTELVFHASHNSVAPKPNSLRLIRSVAAALAPSLLDAIEALFGVPVIQTLGMTEASPLITSTELPPAVRKRGSVGRSCGTRIRIVGRDGKTLDTGATGEVAIRGANVFAGYEGDEEANKTQFRDGWFHTGDTGYLDAEGYLFLTGRIRQMINRGGEKISPQEIDDALLTHPAVAEAASFAVKHRTLGEDVAAAVVLRAPASSEDLRAFLASRLAPFKVPQRIAVLAKLPRNPVGKIDRLSLAEATETAERGGKEHMPPRDELEIFLTHLWAKELGVTGVGIHDDFGALGGDSLSGMRVLMALESALDMNVPDEVFVNFSTIAGISRQLRLLGAKLRTDHDADNGQSTTWSDEDFGKILARVDVGMVGLEGNPEAVARRLKACGRRDEFHILADAMTLYCTPLELSELLRQTGHVRIGSAAAERLSMVAAFRLRMLNRRWRRRVKQEIARAKQASTWKREPLTKTVIHYRGSTPASEKTLIIGFTGNYMRLMMPTYRILLNLDADRYDVVLLRDTSRGGFMRGLEEVGNDIDAICTYAEAVAERGGYRRIVALGTSGGGLAALCAAAQGGWPKAIAVAAASPARHTDITGHLKAAAARHDPQKTQLVLAYSGQNTRDLDAANQLKGFFPALELAAEPGSSAHNLLDKLYHTGGLRDFLARWL